MEYAGYTPDGIRILRADIGPCLSCYYAGKIAKGEPYMCPFINMVADESIAVETQSEGEEMCYHYYDREKGRAWYAKNKRNLDN